MFKPIEKAKISQVSLTGIRSIVILGHLIEAPRTLQEIKDVLKNLNIFETNQSDDIIRIDLNTLRLMGCDITQATRKTNYKYEISKHPFLININLEEISLLKKIYKKIKDSSNIELLVSYDNLFKKLSKFIQDDDIKEAFCGISILKSFDINLIQDLLEDCKTNKILKIIYSNPTRKKDSEKNILTQDLVFKNDKIYLYGYDIDKSRSVVLNLKCIKSIIGRIINSDNIEVKPTKVKFYLKSFGTSCLEENEKILQTCDNGYIIEGNYYNNFIAMQRILSFGANCTVLEPEEFKIKVIEKLKSMRDLYND